MPFLQSLPFGRDLSQSEAYCREGGTLVERRCSGGPPQFKELRLQRRQLQEGVEITNMAEALLVRNYL